MITMGQRSNELETEYAKSGSEREEPDAIGWFGAVSLGFHRKSNDWTCVF